MGPRELPPDEALPVDRLAGIFQRRTNAYKFLYFLSVLDLAENARDRDDLVFTKRDVIVRLLAHAWYPYTYFRLSFGAQDQVAGALEHMHLSARMTPGPRQLGDLRRSIESKITPGVVAELGRYVPTRLIRPFFPPEQLHGYPDHRVDDRLASLSRDRYDTDRPLYRVDNERLTLHPGWLEYLRRNGAIVRGWALWQFAQYMQARNPNVPAVASKLVPIVERIAIPEPARRFWTTARERLGELACPYTTEPVPNDFALDHFVPWTFVVHDQLWNLVPVSKPLNSSKGHRLPPRQSVANLIDAHARALVATRSEYGVNQWSTVIEPYIADLGVPEDALKQPREPAEVARALAPHYERTVGPLLDLASARGFELWAPTGA